jgi:methionine-rich copper-binding protein CopC
MSKTLTPIGLEKIGQRFVDSVAHAAYTLGGEPRTIPPFRRLVEDSAARVYIYFDDTIVGTIEGVQLVDKDGDVIAGTERTFTKPQGKGLYIAFKYNLKEVEVESIENL